MNKKNGKIKVKAGTYKLMVKVTAAKSLKAQADQPQQPSPLSPPLLLPR